MQLIFAFRNFANEPKNKTEPSYINIRAFSKNKTIPVSPSSMTSLLRNVDQQNVAMLNLISFSTII